MPAKPGSSVTRTAASWQVTACAAGDAVAVLAWALGRPVGLALPAGPGPIPPALPPATRASWVPHATIARAAALAAAARRSAEAARRCAEAARPGGTRVL